MLGVFAAPAALLGVVVVNAIPERAAELSFAALLLYVAWTLGAPAWRELRAGDAA